MIDGSGIALQDRQKIRGRGRETGGKKVERGIAGGGGQDSQDSGRQGWGGKIETSNYQMMAVDSGISMRMLSKFSVQAPKQRAAVLCLVCVCI